MDLKQNTSRLKSPLKVWATVGIYLLHLLFFESIMANSDDVAYRQFWKTSTSHKHKKNDSRTLPSDYATLLKHDSSVHRVINAPVFTGCTVAGFDFPPPDNFSAKCLYPQANSLRLPPAAFKRYRLLRVFLI